MEAHAGTISIGNRGVTKPKRHLLTALRERVRARRGERVARNYAARANRTMPSSIPGSEHSHVLPPKAY